jgi:hypothetical protein
MRFILTRSWKSLAGLFSFEKDFNQGQSLPHSVEPLVGFNTYVRRIDWANHQPMSLEYFAGRNPYKRYVIQLHEFVDDAKSSANSFY